MADQKVRSRLSDIKQRVAQKNTDLGFSTLVDIVFVIDGTGSMQNLLDEVKERALSMHEDIIRGLGAKGRRIAKMRVKALVFRDIYVDANAFEESEFFMLPEESGEFRAFIENIRATGGGDEPESSLEALCRAMKMKFQENQQGQKARHIIVLLTDASAHRLDDPQRAVDKLYPKDMPNDLTGVESLWENMNFRAKRLVVFAPNLYPWTEVGAWNSVEYTPSEAGKGIDADTFEGVIAAISGSI